MYERSILAQLLARLNEPRRFIQVLCGPRQVGKTTLARQATARLAMPIHMVAGDGAVGAAWLMQQWEIARLRARESASGALLIVDEVQNLPDWSREIKRLWDEDSATGIPLQVLLLGSSPLMLDQGLSESLAGRFERLTATHWGWPEMRDAFGWDVERYVLFGGYPGAAPLVGDEERWRHYLRDALIEATLSRDILALTRIHKPALLRRLFDLGCRHAGEILSYQKMTGQLQDAGNTTTLAHYLGLLGGAGLLAGVEKFAGSHQRSRASSPKLIPLNTGFVTAQGSGSAAALRQNPESWGRLVETAVGAHLANAALRGEVELFYWRERSQEVDFVLRRGDRIAAIEVKSTLGNTALPGMAAFARLYSSDRMWLVGGQGIGLEEFLSRPVLDWV